MRNKGVASVLSQAPTWRPSSRGNVNGHAMQKKFPAASNATTTIARPYGPRESGKIHRSHWVAEEAVRDDGGGKNQHDRLQYTASVAGAEQ